MSGILSLQKIFKKEKNNNFLRIEFGYKFSLFTIYAREIKGINFIVTDFHRTAAKQNKRFKDGGSLCDGFKAISYHQKWRAKDIVIIDAKGRLIWTHIPEYDILAEIWKGLKGRWGGDWYIKGKTKFDDCYHFEY